MGDVPSRTAKRHDCGLKEYICDYSSALRSQRILFLVEYELEVLHSLLVDRFTFCTTACRMSFSLASVSGGIRQHGDRPGGGTFYYSYPPDESLLLLGTSCVPSTFVVLCNDLDLSQ